MALQKQPITINFAQGLDLKTDPLQVPAGRFLELENTVFDKGGSFQKRDGFGQLPSLLSLDASFLTTFNNNLMAIGKTIQLYAEGSSRWINKGTLLPVSLSVASAVRTANSDVTVDVAISISGIAGSVFVDSAGDALYQITDADTGQIIVPAVALPTGAKNPRVFALANHLIVTYLLAPASLYYIAVPIYAPASPTSPIALLTVVNGDTAGYDGVVLGSNLYIAADGSDIGGAIHFVQLDDNLIRHGGFTPVTGIAATLLSITGDTSTTTPTLWITAWDTSTNDAYTFTLSADPYLPVDLVPTKTISSTVINALTSATKDGLLTIFYQIPNTYPTTLVRSDYIERVTCTSAGVVGTPEEVIRSVGIASKAVQFNDNNYLLATYAGALQPTYFLLNADTGEVIAKLAYSNGSGYAIGQVLPQINVIGSSLNIGYLYKILLTAVNKSQGASTSGIYAQTGINIATFDFSSSAAVAVDVAASLHVTGGFLWQYDGNRAVEHGFHVWPEDLYVSNTPGGGSLTNVPHYYIATYEWTDAQGILHRSAPSIPAGITPAAGSVNSIQIPTLRLTAKGGQNPVRIVLYRWSQDQQTYYQVTSVLSPVLNDPTVDYVTIADGAAPSSILGNAVLYTTGGVVENIAAPAAASIALFKSRVFLLDAEDTNLLWYSKQIIESTPVEMSDLFTLYVAPTTGSQGSTGPSRCLAPLDDKLIVFKDNAIYYIGGLGPDNTGANNDFSDPVFITSTVGCNNQNSIVFMPQGLMFQSDKGIWLLGRDLSTQYIGAPVEEYNANRVVSAISIPGNNQVRFTLDNGVTLMYDYYFAQWGTFSGIPGISSTIFQAKHTFINQFGEAFQETPGSYLDGSIPVTMSLKTAWIQMAGLQGYERAYYFYLLGQYISPHKLSIQVAYDYDDTPIQTTVITPDNYNNPYGIDSPYGGASPYGGNSQVEQWRIFFARQKCQAIQLTIQESFDASLGTIAGAGVSLSGMNVVIGAKKGYPVLPGSRSA